MLILAAVCMSASAFGQTDSNLRTVQQALKDQGFYYGEITGKKDADTTAAIRRYQIRNGLQITGELNAETQKSLGLRGATASTPAPRVTPAPTPVPRIAPAEEEMDDLRDDDEQVAPEPVPPREQRYPSTRDDEFEEDPRELLQRRAGGLFEETPYADAPPAFQQRVIVAAQALLAREGLYRSGVDGVFGPGTEFALRAFQARAGLEETGRFDMETLSALGLLPGQQRRGWGPPRRRVVRPPVIYTPGGERIYVPRRY